MDSLNGADCVGSRKRSGLRGLPERSGLWNGLRGLPERSGLWNGRVGLPERSGLRGLPERSGLRGLPGTERAAWAPGTERAAWAPGTERAAWAPGTEAGLRGLPERRKEGKHPRNPLALAKNVGGQPPRREPRERCERNTAILEENIRENPLLRGECGRAPPRRELRERCERTPPSWRRSETSAKSTAS